MFIYGFDVILDIGVSSYCSEFRCTLSDLLLMFVLEEDKVSV